MRWSFTCEQRETGEQYERLACPHEKGGSGLCFTDENRDAFAISVAIRGICEDGGTAEDETNLAVEDVSFEVWAGEKVMLLGPSGCGKSTLIKAIAGFIRPDGGAISFAGREDLRPGPDRAVVFQESNQLFPWRTVMDNVAFPLRLMGKAGKRPRRRPDGTWR